MKILIVDDFIANIILLRELLSEHHVILTAMNGTEAIEIAKSNSIDIVLLDIMLPDIDGYEVLRILKEHPKTENLIIIMITAKVERDDMKKGIKLGASDYLKKPVDPVELLTKVAFYEKIVADYKKIEQYQVFANIHESMQIAQRFQTCLAPDKDTFNAIFSKSFVLFIPRDFVSGDFYFIAKIGQKKFIALFDCVGHGVPAALLSVFIFSTLNSIVNKEQITDPEIVAKLLHNEAVNILNKSVDMFSTYTSFEAAFCEIDVLNFQLKFVGASRSILVCRKKNKPVYINNEPKNSYFDSENDFSCFPIDGYNLPLGIENVQPEFSTKTLKLELKDRIYMFSDGFYNQLGKDGTIRYSKRSFYNLITGMQNQSIKEHKVLLYNELNEWKTQNQQSDDILVIGIEI